MASSRTPKRGSTSSISVAETKLGVALPEEYATFLRARHADGTATPRVELFTLEAALEHDTFRADLPFPFTKRDAKRILRARAGGEDVFLEAEDSIGGVLPIVDAGCNDVRYLVLTGPLRGTVWSGGEAGWLPHADADGALIGFRDWYATIADAQATPSATPAKTPAAKPGKKPGKTPTKTAKRPPQPLIGDFAAYQLNLRGRGLETLPDEIGDMTRVAMVHLGRNALTELPAAFAKLSRTVITLELGPNPLKRLQGDLLASFSKLDSLDLGGTQLRELPEALAKLPIRILTLGGNPALDLDQALWVLARMPTLRNLSLARCGLTSVPAGLCALTQLDRLYLNDNAITVLPSSLASLQLDVLSVMNNSIAKIPDTLVPRVKSIFFGGNPGARAEKKRFDLVRKGFVMLG